MEKLGLKYGKNNNGVPICCKSCVKGEQKEDGYIQCDSGTLMKPNECCTKEYSLDESKTPEEVIYYVQNFILKNTGI